MIEISQNDVAVESVRPMVFKCDLPLRFADMDADQHVNNAEFYRYMEEARMRWVHTLGLAMTPPAPIPVLAASACSFRAPLYYPGTVTVEIYLGRMGNSSVRTHYLLRSGNAIAAEGYGVSVWVDPKTHKSIPLPDAVRELAAQ
ncbi:MAG TPA: thioesterase family protein [Burkholderiales bacterium]|nr:thioesterase family protein [Burkholderiales bacterium]